MNLKKTLIVAMALAACALTSVAQKFAMVDMEYVLSNVAAYEVANNQLEQLSQRWQKEVENVSREAETMYNNYKSQMPFLTDDQKKKQEAEIVAKEKEAVERYIIDVLTDYNREHTVSLMPMPSVRIINEGSVSVIDIRPKEIDLDDFVRQIGYREIHRDGEWRGFSAPAGQKSYPDILVNTRQNKWYDYNSSDSGDVYALASRITGEEAPSEALWFVAGVLAGKEIHEVRQPWGNKADKSQKAAQDIQTRPNPKRGKHL